MNHSGHLTIETSNVMLDDLYAEDNPEITAGQYVMLAISDTGCGMTPEVIERAFEPFFTTKSEGKGTGLGLSMTYGLVKQSGGHIKIYSEVGHGTTVKIYFPRIHLAEEELPIKHIADIKGGNESILVVEDDMAVQKAVKDTLLTLGYQVECASDAQSALNIIEQGRTFDLLFTDVVMPGPLKSSEMAKIAKEKLPDLVVLFTSGYTQNAIVHGGKLDAGVELINKPYRYADLARKIRMVIEKSDKKTTPTPTGLMSKSPESNITMLGKILVVEDNLEAQATLCELLSMLGYEAIGASSAEEALALLAEVDILLTDVNLPGISGTELAIRCHAQDASKPIIISSGMDTASKLPFAVQLLPKPFSMAILSEILDKASKQNPGT
jgi:CheY-like chemotaxis protein